MAAALVRVRGVRGKGTAGHECGKARHQSVQGSMVLLLAIVNFCKNESPKMLRSFVLLALFGASAAGVTKTTMTVSERMTCTTHIAT